MSTSIPSAFDYAFSITVGVEGGYVSNPADPGGATKYGISQSAYPNVDIANLTLDQAKQIYLTDYWQKAGCDLVASVSPALACLLFDAAVNNGVGAAVRWLQGALGQTADGVIGPQTQAAITTMTDPTNIIALFHGERIVQMASMSGWATFGRGWSRRLAQLPYQAAQATASIGNLGSITLV